MVFDDTSEAVIVDSSVVDSGLLDKTTAVITVAVKPSIFVDVIMSTLVDINGSLVDMSSTVV